MRRYRALQAAIAVAFSAYIVMPPLATLLVPQLRGEMFPLSMWSMFYRVHNRVDDFGLLVLSVGDESLGEGVYFESAQDRFARAHSGEAYFAIQALGRAAAGGNEGRTGELVQVIADNYFRTEHPVRFRLMRRVWNPLDRWQHGTFETEDAVREFATDPGGEGARAAAANAG